MLILKGMTKVKLGKEESTSADFVERRRASLERYLVIGLRPVSTQENGPRTGSEQNLICSCAFGANFLSV